MQAQDIQHQRGDDLKEYLLDSVKFVAPDYSAGFVKIKDGKRNFIAGGARRNTEKNSGIRRS